VSERITTENQDSLLVLIAAHPSGIGVKALLAQLHDAVSRRTLQRWLGMLVQDQKVVALGAGRALRYRTANRGGAVFPAMTVDARAETYVPTSPEGDEIKAYVRRPLHERSPVGYDIRFLEAYVPNRSCYLPASVRAHLLALGRSSVTTKAPAGTFARDILDRLLIDLSWASSRLEGNTYTRLDTERLIAFGQAGDGKDGLETKMILNHKDAIQFLVGDPTVRVDVDTLMALHALLSDGLLADAAAGGRVRRRAVHIGGSVYQPSAWMPQQLEEMLVVVVDTAAKITHPIEQAFFLMVHLPYLQPFEDVNKRVSRLAANIPLLRHNLSPLSFIDVPPLAYVDGTLGVYELRRIELLRDVFVWAYERSCQQYVAVRQQLVPPDTFRLRFRSELSSAVQAIVRGGLPLTQAALVRVTPKSLPTLDRPRFRTLVRDEFKTLHAGNVIRHALRPLEFSAWRAKRSQRG
jgi:Fic/DOC family